MENLIKVACKNHDIQMHTGLKHILLKLFRYYAIILGNRRLFLNRDFHPIFLPTKLFITEVYITDCGFYGKRFDIV